MISMIGDVYRELKNMTRRVKSRGGQIEDTWHSLQILAEQVYWGTLDFRKFCEIYKKMRQESVENNTEFPYLKCIDRVNMFARKGKELRWK